MTRTSAGFTLMEALVASVVLATGLLLVLQAITSSVGASGRVSSQVEAHALAADQLAQAVAGALPALPAEGIEQRGPVLYEWRVERIGTEGRLDRLRAEVRWSRQGQDHAITLHRRALAEGAAQ